MNLRSRNWYGGSGLYPFLRRTGMNAQGFPHGLFGNRPVIGICNSWSELTHCNAHLRTVADAVKRGVWENGGVPLEFPTISVGEATVMPTAMLLRNLMAMDVEEMILRQPLDGVVLLCGCDKTTPAQLMGAASANIPAIMVPGGPMLSGQWRGDPIGSGTDVFRFYDQYRTGALTEEEFVEIESCLSRSAGHCMTMGTASTMTSLAEAMGMTLPGCASIPAADSRRLTMAHMSGRRIVELVREELRPSEIMTRQALENAIVVLMALGGSTNAVIHLLALAGRLGIDLTLKDFDRCSRSTPLLANIRPSGTYLMEDFFYAGGLPALMREIADLLHQHALTVSGHTVGDNISQAQLSNSDVIRPRASPVQTDGGIVVVRGNLAPNGAVLKQSAATPRLLAHRGRAVVFRNREDLLARIDSPSLDVDADSVLVLQNAGPRGAPGMPEWGHLPIPRKLLDQGVMDMVRISDARMSGTSYGTIVVHIAPESAVGGPLAVVQDGDLIDLDAHERSLNLVVPDTELRARLAAWHPAPPVFQRGYGRLFLDHVLQADQGCDFDFLRASGYPDEDIAARYARMGHS